jgi:hypothetical protein
MKETAWRKPRRFRLGAGAVCLAEDADASGPEDAGASGIETLRRRAGLMPAFAALCAANAGIVGDFAP